MYPNASIKFRILTFIVTFLMFLSSAGFNVGGVIEALKDTFEVRNEENPEVRAQIITDLLLENKGETFESSTCEIAKELVYAVLTQFMTGSNDSGALGDALAKLPTEDIDRGETRQYEGRFSKEFNDWCIGVFKDSKLPDNVKSFLVQYSSGINDLYVYLVPTEYEGVYEFRGSYVTNSGDVVEVVTGAYYDTVTGMVYGKDNNGVFGIGFDFDTKTYVIQNPVNAWMRMFGYNIAYDILGNQIFMDCDTVRVKFKSGGKDWMIQFWKGNYTSLTNGAEIGIYYLKGNNKIQYTCAEFEDMLEMRFDLKHGDEILFTRDWQEHWWLSGYQLGQAVKKEDLALDCAIRFEDEEMKNAFVAAAAEHKNEMSVTVDGLQVNVIWQ